MQFPEGLENTLFPLLFIFFSGFSAAFVVIDDADNFDYTPFESAAPLRNNYERKPPRQKAL